jgi:hypothetical protein
MTWRPRAMRAGLVAALAVGYACSEVSTNPNTVLSLELRPMQLPSIVIGDSIHDTLGAVDSLHAVAFNAQGNPVPGAPIRYFTISGRKLTKVDSVSGQAIGLQTVDTLFDTLGNVRAIETMSRVIAAVGALQTVPDTIFVVEFPDSLAPLDSTVYPLDYTRGTNDTLLPIRVRLLHLPSDSVPHYRLQYSYTYPLPHDNTDPAKVQLVNVAGLPQLIDTTQFPSGLSTLSLRATFLTDTVTDSLGIDVSAFTPDHHPVHGSPLHFTILLHIH